MLIASKYKSVVRELENSPCRRSQKESFDAMQFALKRWGIDIDRKKVIVVAGSNGKGSVCATLEALLKSAGKRVGTLISPHLVEVTERIRLDSRDVSRTLFCEAYRKVKAEFHDLGLTYIETITLMALWVFFARGEDEQVDYAILEVSIGGLWDVANAVPHKNCLIGRLGLEHAEFLGGGLDKIAKHKFGIVNKHCKVVHAAVPDEIAPIVDAYREKFKGKWFSFAESDFEVIYRKRQVVFGIISKWGRADISLPGRRGVENTQLALQMFECLGFDPSEHLESLAKIEWPCRMERWSWDQSECPIYLSGDHNPQGLKSLIELLEYYPRKRLHLLLALGTDRNVDEMLEPLFELPNTKIYLTRAPYKSRGLREYKQWYKMAEASWANPSQAIKGVAKRASREDMIVVTGSLYLVGRVRELIKEQRAKAPVATLSSTATTAPS